MLLGVSRVAHVQSQFYFFLSHRKTVNPINEHNDPATTVLVLNEQSEQPKITLPYRSLAVFQALRYAIVTMVGFPKRSELWNSNTLLRRRKSRCWNTFYGYRRMVTVPPPGQIRTCSGVGDRPPTLITYANSGRQWRASPTREELATSILPPSPPADIENTKSNTVYQTIRRLTSSKRLLSGSRADGGRI